MLANDPVTQARIDLTTALRAAARHGLNEGVCNHFSMTVPGREDLFLVNPQGLHWSEITHLNTLANKLHDGTNDFGAPPEEFTHHVKADIDAITFRASWKF